MTSTEMQQKVSDVLHDALKEGVVDILRSMGYLEALHQSQEETLRSHPKGKFASYIEVKGEGFEGAVLTSMDEALVKMLVSSFICVPEDELSPSDLTDGIAELSNMTAGRIKMALAYNTSETFKLSIPDSTREGQLQNHPLMNIPGFEHSFDVNGETLTMQVAFQFS